MATPTVTASLNKSVYTPGETMTLTVNYGDTDSQSITLTIVATDSSGASSDPVTVSALIDPVTLSVTSVPAKTWTKQSDTGSVAVFTASA